MFAGVIKGITRQFRKKSNENSSLSFPGFFSKNKENAVIAVFFLKAQLALPCILSATCIDTYIGYTKYRVIGTGRFFLI
jgi:hypothetical protein